MTEYFDFEYTYFYDLLLFVCMFPCDKDWLHYICSLYVHKIFQLFQTDT